MKVYAPLFLVIFFVFFLFPPLTNAQDGCTPGPSGCSDRIGQIRNMYNNGRGCTFKCGRFTGVCANSGHCVLERINDNLCEDTVANNPCGRPADNQPSVTPALSPTLAASPTASVSASLKNSDQMSSLMYYLVISGIYILTIYFAIGIKGQFKFFGLIGFFVLGAVIGYYLNTYETGLIVAIVLSLVFW